MMATSIVHLRNIRAEIGQDVFATVMAAFEQEISASLDRFERAVVQGCGTRAVAAHRLSGALISSACPGRLPASMNWAI